MFEKFLLPLDGSILAESAIPWVRDLAEQLKAEVYILNICPPERQKYLHMHQFYLNHLAEYLKKEMPLSQVLKIQAEVVVGDPVKEITDYVKNNKIDMVALTSHGTSGYKSLSIGSVADRVVRGSGVPTLMIRIKAEQTSPVKTKPIEKILVPIENAETGKVVIPYVIELAGKIKASVILFSLTQTVYSQNFDNMGAGAGVNWDAIDKATLQYVNDYLQNIEDELKKAGVNADHTTYLGMDTALEILEMEKKTQADLVIMATRGRSQVARWAFGSAAEKVLRGGTLPLLLIKTN
jgi:nucleotide-binding universal stress UspA family protein